MASQATFSGNCRTVHPDGRVEFHFSDGGGVEFQNSEAVDIRLAEMDSDLNACRLMAIAYWKARDPDFSNPNLVRDKAFQYDLSANDPIKLNAQSQDTGIMARSR